MQNNEPITNVAPVTNAPQTQPKPRQTETQLSGPGSQVFQIRRFFVQHTTEVPGIGEPASMSGNRSLWFASPLP